MGAIEGGWQVGVGHIELKDLILDRIEHLEGPLAIRSLGYAPMSRAPDGCYFLDLQHGPAVASFFLFLFSHTLMSRLDGRAHAYPELLRVWDF